jgi:uncharacterized protein
MRKYLKESLHWLHLPLFKPITLEAETRGLTRKQAVLLYLRVLPVQLVVILSVIAFLGILSESAGIEFIWPGALLFAVLFGLVGGLLFGLGIGMAGDLVLGLGAGLAGGLVGGLSGGLVGGLVVELGLGLVIGLGTGMIAGLVGALVGRLGVQVGPSAGLVFGMGGGLVLGLVFALVEGLREGLRAGFAYAGVFFFVYLRLLHIVPYASQRWRSRKAADPFLFFRNSPVYWDEAIAMPLPFLSDWLVNLATFDRQRGMNEIVKVARLPYQRRAAQRALVTVLLQDLKQADSVEKVASATEALANLPSDAQYLPTGLADAARHIHRIDELTNDYLTRITPVGQMSVIKELRSALEAFRDAMVLTKPPVGPAFQSVAMHWLEVIKVIEVGAHKRIAVEPIPNSFVVGNPLMVRDKNLFKGRKDIIVAIEENIINSAQRPALLLYGRRRIGKTSTLLNLPVLLSSSFVPVFIDCQDAKWREGDDAFCYHLATSLHQALNQRGLVEMSRRPRFDRFEQYAFTRLGEYLDQIEESSRAAHKQILLTLDEYEKLEEGISASKVTTEVLNQLRTIVQHRERIVVLFSGSHRFEEMRTINWSDYLINVKTLELSYLGHEDARELITEPVPLLQYESGVIEQIIAMTHCQPYLLQAVASDLVNYLNSEKRMLATAADLEIAVEKVLVTAQAYFFYTWTSDCSEAEREVLRMIAIRNTESLAIAEDNSSLRSLCHKEILETQGGGYRFSIELFRRWVLKNQTAQPLTTGDLPEPADLEYADLLTSHK